MLRFLNESVQVEMILFYTGVRVEAMFGLVL